MAELYADGLTIRIASYGDMPLPEEFEEGRVIEVFVSDRVDPSRLIEEIEDGLVPAPFFLDQSWRHHSWGAHAAFLEILIGVSATIGGIKAAIEIADKIARKVRKRDINRAGLTAEEAAVLGRRHLAHFIKIDAEQSRVADLQTSGDTYTIMLEANGNTYRVDMDARRGVYRFERVGRPTRKVKRVKQPRSLRRLLRRRKRTRR